MFHILYNHITEDRLIDMYIDNKRIVTEVEKNEWMMMPIIQQHIIDDQVKSLIEYELAPTERLLNNINNNWKLLESADIHKSNIYRLVGKRKAKYYADKMKQLLHDLKKYQEFIKVVEEDKELVNFIKKDIFNIKQQINKLITN